MEARGLANAGRITGIIGAALMLIGAAWALAAFAFLGGAAGGPGFMMTAGPLEQGIVGLILVTAVIVPLIAGVTALVLSIRYPTDTEPPGVGGPVGILICGILGLLGGAGFGLGALAVVAAGIMLLVDANGAKKGSAGRAPPA